MFPISNKFNNRLYSILTNLRPLDIAIKCLPKRINLFENQAINLYPRAIVKLARRYNSLLEILYRLSKECNDITESFGKNNLWDQIFKGLCAHANSLLKEHGKSTQFEQTEERSFQGTKKSEEKRRYTVLLVNKVLNLLVAIKQKRLIKDLTLLSQTASIENKLRRIEKKEQDSHPISNDGKKPNESSTFGDPRVHGKSNMVLKRGYMVPVSQRNRRSYCISFTNSGFRCQRAQKNLESPAMPILPKITNSNTKKNWFTTETTEISSLQPNDTTTVKNKNCDPVVYSRGTVISNTVSTVANAPPTPPTNTDVHAFDSNVRSPSPSPRGYLPTKDPLTKLCSEGLNEFYTISTPSYTNTQTTDDTNILLCPLSDMFQDKSSSSEPSNESDLNNMENSNDLIQGSHIERILSNDSGSSSDSLPLPHYPENRSYSTENGMMNGSINDNNFSSTPYVNMLEWSEMQSSNESISNFQKNKSNGSELAESKSKLYATSSRLIPVSNRSSSLPGYKGSKSTRKSKGNSNRRISYFSLKRRKKSVIYNKPQNKNVPPLDYPNTHNKPVSTSQTESFFSDSEDSDFEDFVNKQNLSPTSSIEYSLATVPYVVGLRRRSVRCLKGSQTNSVRHLGSYKRAGLPTNDNPKEHLKLKDLKKNNTRKSIIVPKLSSTSSGSRRRVLRIGAVKRYSSDSISSRNRSSIDSHIWSSSDDKKHQNTNNGISAVTSHHAQILKSSAGSTFASSISSISSVSDEGSTTNSINPTEIRSLGYDHQIDEICISSPKSFKAENEFSNFLTPTRSISTNSQPTTPFANILSTPHTDVCPITSYTPQYLDSSSKRPNFNLSTVPISPINFDLNMEDLDIMSSVATDDDMPVSVDESKSSEQQEFNKITRTESQKSDVLTSLSPPHEHIVPIRNLLGGDKDDSKTKAIRSSSAVDLDTNILDFLENTDFGAGSFGFLQLNDYSQLSLHSKSPHEPIQISKNGVTSDLNEDLPNGISSLQSVEDNYRSRVNNPPVYHDDKKEDADGKSGAEPNKYTILDSSSFESSPLSLSEPASNYGSVQDNSVSGFNIPSQEVRKTQIYEQYSKLPPNDTVEFPLGHSEDIHTYYKNVSSRSQNKISNSISNDSITDNSASDYIDSGDLSYKKNLKKFDSLNCLTDSETDLNESKNHSAISHNSSPNSKNAHKQLALGTGSRLQIFGPLREHIFDQVGPKSLARKKSAYSHQKSTSHASTFSSSSKEKKLNGASHIHSSSVSISSLSPENLHPSSTLHHNSPSHVSSPLIEAQMLPQTSPDLLQRESRPTLTSQPLAISSEMPTKLVYNVATKSFQPQSSAPAALYHPLTVNPPPTHPIFQHPTFK